MNDQARLTPLSAVQAEVVAGLTRRDKHLPSKYFYDARGAQLFEQICELPEYYPTRTEIAILRSHLPEIAASLGPQRWVVEPGSGSGLKTRLLLEALQQPAGYVPIDISEQQLLDYADELGAQFPDLLVRPMHADFSADLTLPKGIENPVVWFPGSTIGNFSRQQAGAFLSRLTRWGHGPSELLLGVDLVKPVDVLEAAYNDASGITAAFNLNMLNHLNQAAGADFQPAQFRHEARWNGNIGAIQMFLISRCEQQVTLAGQTFSLQRDEPICTEYSHKYQPQALIQLASQAGWTARACYRDPQNWFGVFHLECV